MAGRPCAAGLGGRAGGGRGRPREVSRQIRVSAVVSACRARTELRRLGSPGPACWEASCEPPSTIRDPVPCPLFDRNSPGSPPGELGVEGLGLATPRTHMAFLWGPGNRPVDGLALAVQMSRCQPISSYNRESVGRRAAALICPAAASKPFLCSFCGRRASRPGLLGLLSEGLGGGCRQSRCP